MKNIRLAAITAAAIFGSTMVLAVEPEVNINPARHPNLEAAQELVHQAAGKLGAARDAKDWDTQGHAAKALDMLQQVNLELKAAADALDKNKK